MTTHSFVHSFRRAAAVMAVICFLWAADARGSDAVDLSAQASCSVTDVNCWITLVKKMSKDVESLMSDVIPAVEKTLKDVETGVTGVETTFSTLENGATKAVGQFGSTMETIEKGRGEPADQFLALSDDLVSRMTDEWTYLTSELDAQAADYKAFVGTDGQCTHSCDEFRREIGGVIRRFGQVSQAGTHYLETQLQASGVGTLTTSRTFDTGSWAQEIEGAPAILLYPLHLAVNGISGSSAGELAPSSAVRATCAGGGYCGVLNSIHDSLDKVEHAFSQLGQASLTTRATASTWPPPCDGEDLNSSMSDLAYILFVYGAIQTTIAIPLQSAGFAGLDTTVSPGADAAASVEIAFKARPLRQLSHGLKMVGDPPLTAGTILLNRIDDCRNRLNAQLLLCRIIDGDDCQNRVRDGEVFGF